MAKTVFDNARHFISVVSCEIFVVNFINGDVRLHSKAAFSILLH